MRSFEPKLLRVASDSAETLNPVPFDGRIDERTLESQIAANPALVGEPLLILGQQLAEFEEDKDRLDLLAVDKDGEIVVIELKVAEDFRLTDLQALAYAGAYADRQADDFAQTLRRYLEKSLSPNVTDPPSPAGSSNSRSTEAPADRSGVRAEAHGSDPILTGAKAEPATATESHEGTGSTTSVSIETAKTKLVEFLEVDDFESWQPSQQVRIKLVAPSFPRRVLKNVKHLGDVYGMPIEAITARLHEAPTGELTVAFERVLPLPGEEEFDLTLRRREERKREANLRRRKRPSVVPLLIEHGKLVDGQTLYVDKTVLPAADRDRFDPSSVAFQVTLHVPEDGPPKFAWRRNSDSPPLEFSPSAIAHEIYKSVLDGWSGDAFSTAVATSFTLEPGGKTLATVALDEGLWSQTEPPAQ